MGQMDPQQEDAPVLALVETQPVEEFEAAEYSQTLEQMEFVVVAMRLAAQTGRLPPTNQPPE